MPKYGENNDLCISPHVSTLFARAFSCEDTLFYGLKHMLNKFAMLIFLHVSMDEKVRQRGNFRVCLVDI